MLTLTDGARRRANRLGLGVVAGSSLLFLVVAPGATTPLTPVPSLVAVQQSALLIFDLLTAMLLFGQFVVLRSRAFFVLACGYVFAAFMAAAFALTFSGVFSPTGLLGAGPQTTAWIYVFWHAGFPASVIGYGVLAGASAARKRSDGVHIHRRDVGAIVAGVLVTLLVACAVTAVAVSRWHVLPVLIVGGVYTPAMTGTVTTCGFLCLVALGLLWLRQHLIVLDVWLRAVMSVWLFDMALSGLFSAARFDLGWYGGHFFSLLAASLLLVLLLSESVRNHLRLVVTSRELGAANTDLERRIATRTSELVLALEAAHAANRAKSAFLATMSHEIRTPMNGVIGMVEVLHHSDLPKQHAQAVETMRTSAFMLLGIIDNILDFSKIEAGRMELEHAVLALPELLEGVCATLLPLARDKDVELSLFISPHLPARIWSDPVRLGQVLFNLAGNAIKFSARTIRRRGRVSIRAEIPSGTPPRLVLSVVDNGIGIAPEVKARLFTPFMQADSSTTRRFGGTGLGLTITSRLLTLMDGTLEVESRLGEGSTFVACIPLKAVAGMSPSTQVDLDRVECVIVGLGERADSMRIYLEAAGAHVHPVPDIAGALRATSGMELPIVIHAGWRDTQSTSLLRAAFAARPVRHVLVTRGRRWDVLQPAPDVVAVDGNCLRRVDLLEAVGVAAGRMTPRPDGNIEQRGSGRFTQEALGVDEARRQGRLILIAEDDEVNQIVIRRQVEILGYAAEIAGDGEEALRLWRSGGYPLLLTDGHMPKMDGYALARAIRAEELDIPGQPRMPILVLTADALVGEAVRAQAAGIDEHLIKPLQPEGSRKRRCESGYPWTDRTRSVPNCRKKRSRRGSPSRQHGCSSRPARSASPGAGGPAVDDHDLLPFPPQASSAIWPRAWNAGRENR